MTNFSMRVRRGFARIPTMPLQKDPGMNINRTFYVASLRHTVHTLSEDGAHKNRIPPAPS